MNEKLPTAYRNKSLPYDIAGRMFKLRIFLVVAPCRLESVSESLYECTASIFWTSHLAIEVFFLD
jgi:hypothetical protein